MNQEGQEIFDLKSLTKEEVAWLDFAREQYLVRWDDMREALKIAQRIEIELKETWGNKVKIRELTKNRKIGKQENRKIRELTKNRKIGKLTKNRKIGKWRADRVQITLP